MIRSLRFLEYWSESVNVPLLSAQTPAARGTGFAVSGNSSEAGRADRLFIRGVRGAVAIPSIAAIVVSFSLMVWKSPRCSIRHAIASAAKLDGEPGLNRKTYMTVTAALFFVVATAHLLRVILGWPVEIAGWSVPFWVSWLGVLVAGALAYFGFMQRR
jgi:hypothetical protein